MRFRLCIVSSRLGIKTHTPTDRVKLSSERRAPLRVISRSKHRISTPQISMTRLKSNSTERELEKQLPAVLERTTITSQMLAPGKQHETEAESSKKKPKGPSNSRRKAFIALSYIVIAYVVCWVPFQFVFDVSLARPEAISGDLYTAMSVSYTHLTLPTILRV